MRALTFILNGKQLCVAAPGGDGIVISHVVMPGGLPDTSPLNMEVRLRVGGIGDEHHLEWISQLLTTGDKVEILVVDVSASDPPATRVAITDTQRERLRVASNPE